VTEGLATLPPTLPRGRLLAALQQCRAVTERHAKTFSLAAHLLPPELRAACYAVYAFCRRADDSVDSAPSEPAARAALLVARDHLQRAFGTSGPDDADPEVAALAWACRSHHITRAPLEELLDGMALDLTPVRVGSWSELHRYCALAAGTVGRALGPALGAGPEAAAAAEALGVAMQLTNILRDVAEDAAAGRVYLAEDELSAAGLSHAALLAASRPGQAASGPPGLPAFVEGQIERAREWYARAEPGIALIPSWRARLCVRAMGVLYGEILTALEAQGHDPYRGRARVSLGRKLWLAAACVFGRKLPRPKARTAGALELESVARAAPLNEGP
jgi:phytoene synthase